MEALLKRVRILFDKTFLARIGCLGVHAFLFLHVFIEGRQRNEKNKITDFILFFSTLGNVALTSAPATS